MSKAEENLVSFLKKLGVEDVLPILKKGGVGSVKGLYDRSFEEWRAMGISYGDCCYLDSSKPATIEDDEADERLEQERKKKEEEEEKKKKKRELQEKLAKEKLDKEEQERKEQERLAEEEEAKRIKAIEEQEREEREEQERLENEEQDRKELEEKEKTERILRARKEKRMRRKVAKKEKFRLAKEERERDERARIEKEEQERQEKEEAERQAKIEEQKRIEQEEAERKAKEEQERIEREEAERKAKEEAEEEARKKKAEEEEAAAAAAEAEERRKKEEEKEGPKSPKRKKSAPLKVPSLSLGDIPLATKHIKPLSARSESKKSDIALTSPRSVREKGKKKDKKKDKKKEKKDKEREKQKEKTEVKEVEFKVPALPIKKGKSTDERESLKKSKKKSHKKTKSISAIYSSSDERVSPRTSKEEMLKMGNASGKRKDNAVFLLSPREQLNLGRRNTVSELYPPETSVDFIAPRSARLNKIIKCQAIARGFITRKWYQRWRVAKEILATEHSYVEDLDLILKTFVAPLEKRVLDNEPIIDRNHIYYIFYNLREIYAEHQTILRLLTNRIDNRHEFDKKGLADIFSTNVAKPLTHLYFPYVNNYAQSIKVLKKTKRDHKEFAEFITKAEARPECHLQDLESLLILPIQRVTRYSILLKSLLGKYKAESDQHEELDEAYKTIRDRLNEINECKRDAENMAYVDEMLRAFSYEKGTKEVEFSARRRFVREGTVYRDFKHKETKPIYLILFSDILVIAKMKERKGGSVRSMVTKNYQVRDIIRLSDISRVSLSHANEKECKSFVFHTAKKAYEYYLLTTEHCRSWAEIIQTSLTKAVEMKNQSMRKKKGEPSEYQGLRKPVADKPSTKNSSTTNNNHGEDEFAYG